MLRGFWLAVGGLAVIVQFVLPLFQYDARSVPGQVLAVAWGAAALYAVGAAITLFSTEREERTRDFLQLLPDRWLPMFVGKVLLGLLSAVALALVLTLTGWMIAKGMLPTETVVRETLAVVGVAIVEALVWGLLFSLWMKQPLLAAIVSMAVASFGAQVAVVISSGGHQALTSTSYAHAVPLRLLICLGVFLVDLWLASRWLRPATGASPQFFNLRSNVKSLTAQKVVAGSFAKVRPRRRRMFASLLWQTWRESWKTMLAAVPIALLLMSAISMASWLSGVEAIAMFLCPLLLPALFGALVFRADQRPGHRQFLVAHAGRPRYVWLARHVVWLTGLVVLSCVLYFCAVLLAGSGLWKEIQDQLNYLTYNAGYSPPIWTTASLLQSQVSMFWIFTKVGGCALLAAYGLGQLCSMLLAREVLAGFLAMLLAAVLMAWAIVVGVWDLNPGWFLLPIGVVTMAATWLRAPDWIVGRNSPRAWLAPAVALVLPLGLVFFTLPQARLAQIEKPSRHVYNSLQEPLADSLRKLEATQAEASKTATDYEQLYARFVPREDELEDVRIEGMSYIELLKSFQPEPDPNEEAMGGYGGEGEGMGWYGGAMGGYGGKMGEERGAYLAMGGEGTLTPEQQELVERFGKAAEQAYVEANQGVIQELDLLSQRPHFSVFVDRGSDGYTPWGNPDNFKRLLFADASQLVKEGQLKTAFQRLLCAARIEGQLLSNQRTNQVANAVSHHSPLYGLAREILAWAKHPDQTSQSLKMAIRDLQEVYANYPKLREAVLADHLLLRDVLLDKEPPSFLMRIQRSEKAKEWSDYLPFLANKLSWERERALQSLDILTELRLNFMDRVTSLLESGEDRRGTNRKRFVFASTPYNHDWRSERIVNESVYDGYWDHYSVATKQVQRCRTSYLLHEELVWRIGTQRFLIIAVDAGSRPSWFAAAVGAARLPA